MKTALLGFDGGSVIPGAVRMLDTTPLPGKAALIGILGEKGARQEIDRIFTLASDAVPATRAAALVSLAQLAGEPDLPRLVAMLETASESGEVLRLQEAVAAAARRVADPSLRGAALVALLEEATPARQAAILRVLPKVGGRRPSGRGPESRQLRPPGPDRGCLASLPVARLSGRRRASPDYDGDR